MLSLLSDLLSFIAQLLYCYCHQFHCTTVVLLLPSVSLHNCCIVTAISFIAQLLYCYCHQFHCTTIVLLMPSVSLHNYCIVNAISFITCISLNQYGVLYRSISVNVKIVNVINKTICLIYLLLFVFLLFILLCYMYKHRTFFFQLTTSRK